MAATMAVGKMIRISCGYTQRSVEVDTVTPEGVEVLNHIGERIRFDNSGKGWHIGPTVDTSGPWFIEGEGFKALRPDHPDYARV